MSKLDVSDMNQHGNIMTVNFKSYYPSTRPFTALSQELNLCGTIRFQIKHSGVEQSIENVCCMLSSYYCIKLSKISIADPIIYKVKIMSDELQNGERIFLVADDSFDNANWQIFFELNSEHYVNLTCFTEFDLKLSLEIFCNTFAGFPSLYDDTLSDFELRGVGGSVRVHKAVLAHYSPVMKTMLTGDWKETSAGAVEVADATKETLQQLKDYMYLQKLPEFGVERLATLGSYYMISDLEHVCTVKLLMTLTGGNVMQVLEFAAKYKMEKLMMTILVLVGSGLIKVE